MDFLNYLSWLIISVNPTIELPELTQDWEIDSWREQTEPCAPGPRRKEQWPHKRLSQACLWVSGSLQWRRGLVVACWWAGGTECSSTYMGSFERGHHYLHYLHHSFSSVQSLSRVWLCNPLDCSTPGLPVHHQLPELPQTHVHWVGDAIQPSHPLSSPSPPAFNLSQHQGLFQWVGSSIQLAKVLEILPQHQSLQLIFRVDFL